MSLTPAQAYLLLLAIVFTIVLGFHLLFRRH